MGTYLTGKITNDCPKAIQDGLFEKLGELGIWINTDNSLQTWVNNLNGKSGTEEDHKALPYLERPVTVETLQEHLSYFAKWGEFSDKITGGDYYDEERANDVLEVLSGYIKYLTWTKEVTRIEEDFNIYSIYKEELQALKDLPREYCLECKDFPQITHEDKDELLSQILAEQSNLYNLVSDVPGVYEKLQDLFYNDVEARWEEQNK